MLVTETYIDTGRELPVGEFAKTVTFPLAVPTTVLIVLVIEDPVHPTGSVQTYPVAVGVIGTL
jgi:hypothetical protein